MKPARLQDKCIVSAVLPYFLSGIVRLYEAVDGNVDSKFEVMIGASVAAASIISKSPRTLLWGFAAAKVCPR